MAEGKGSASALSAARAVSGTRTGGIAHASGANAEQPATASAPVPKRRLEKSMVMMNVPLSQYSARQAVAQTIEMRDFKFFMRRKKSHQPPAARLLLFLLVYA
jgi:hypothetical protein